MQKEKKEEELRGKYKTERSKLRLDCKIAEEQFKEEYEKWKARNRDDEERPTFSENLSPDQMAAFGYIKQMRRNFFVQGQAGTGKSTLIRYLKEHLKRPLLLASPTGAAAKLIGGSTLHSLFKLPRNNFINIGSVQFDEKPVNQEDIKNYIIYKQKPIAGSPVNLGKYIDVWLTKDKSKLTTEIEEIQISDDYDIENFFEE